jgi:hypothetical protein
MNGRRAGEVDRAVGGFARAGFVPRATAVLPVHRRQSSDANQFNKRTCAILSWVKCSTSVAVGDSEGEGKRGLITDLP